MKNTKESIDLFLPVYNEEKNLERNITKLTKFLKKSHLEHIQLNIVDDNSKDDTETTLKTLKKRFNINYVCYKTGPSRRENLADAMSKSKKKFVLFMDFDLATDINFLPNLINELKNGNDIVTGSRYLKESKLSREKNRFIISKIYNSFMRIYHRSKIKDHQCGFKGFKKESFLKIHKITGYDHKFRRGWFWDAEVLIIAQHQQMKVKEIPINWKAGKQTSFNIKRELLMIPSVLKLRFRT